MKPLLRRRLRRTYTESARSCTRGGASRSCPDFANVLTVLAVGLQLLILSRQLLGGGRLLAVPGVAGLLLPVGLVLPLVHLLGLVVVVVVRDRVGVPVLRDLAVALAEVVVAPDLLAVELDVVPVVVELGLLLVEGPVVMSAAAGEGQVRCLLGLLGELLGEGADVLGCVLGVALLDHLGLGALGLLQRLAHGLGRGLARGLGEGLAQGLVLVLLLVLRDVVVVVLVRVGVGAKGVSRRSLKGAASLTGGAHHRCSGGGSQPRHP